MAILGLGSDKLKKSDSKKNTKNGKADSSQDEAAEILAKMEAKKDDGDCPFC
ncbi:MAG: hypothetical protein R3313_03905 [Candidatus Saccharimonadales bacterium]|nr:hypothetical protein [Candidatus Saccharimonadales bacterium]